MTGQVVAAALMFLGVALFSILTATLASSFASRAQTSANDQFASIHDRLERIERNQLEDVPARRDRVPRRPRRQTPAPRMGHQQLSEEE